MIGKLAKDDRRELFRTRLADLINPQYELALLGRAKSVVMYAEQRLSRNDLIRIKTDNVQVFYYIEQKNLPKPAQYSKKVVSLHFI
jgi:hypothetical protein